MKEIETIIETKDGPMSTFITHPEEQGPFPVVLFLMDAPGKREELHDMARRIASTGYYVMLPNLYYRKAANFVMEFTEKGREEMNELMFSLSSRMVVNDCQSLLAHADNDDNAKDGAIGVVGYCMSGPFAFAMAGEMPERVRAAASVYGVRLYGDVERSPHLTAKNIKGEMYFAMAETDEYAPKEMVDGLDAYLKEIDINYRVEWYPGTQHGFAFPGRGEKYNKQAAERHWERLHSLFRRNL